MHQKICIVIRIWFHRKSFNLKNSSRLWPSRKLCDLSIDSIKSRPSFLNDSCKCFSFRRFQSLLPFFSPSIHRLHGGKREKKNGPFVIFVSWTVICIIRGLSTGSHEQWCRCIMKMRTGSRERPWYSYHAPLVHYRCSNTFFKQRFLPLLLFSCQISCRAFHLRRRNEKRRKINENRLWITLKPLSRINISILIDIVEL